ncbi:SNF2-related protein [Actinomycetes bacterium KLBMP 9797]
MDDGAAAVVFRPAGQADLAPSGEAKRIRANIAALHVLRAIQSEQRPATADEQRILARWSGWGAVPGVFDPDRDDHVTYAWAREQLAELLDEEGWRAARRTTLNAHYTDANVVQAVWDAVQELGFTGGDVLEPGSGSGNFIAFAPPTARMVGVELDPTTAAISAALYPNAHILNESFADTRTRAGTFDLVVGNVPFGQITPHDRRYNAAGHSIHDYFMVKGLHLLRPGGLMAVLTSHYSMDRGNPAARREIAELADLVGAVRLPSGAMAKAAGTDAVMDVLILRRREDDRPPAPAQSWETTRRITIGEDDVRVNGYFLDHPERVLGRMGTGGLHREDELVIKGDRDCAPALAAALREIIAEAETRGLRYSSLPAQAQRQPIALVAATQQQPEGYFAALPDGRFTQVADGQPQPYSPPKTQAQELRELLRLRDTAMRLLEAEAATRDDTDEIDDLRTELGRHYDSYLARYGPINRYNTYETGKVDEDTGEPIMRRVAPAQGGFRTDPFSNLVYALERFDEAAQTATKADVFTTRAIAPRAPKLGAETPEDAIAICQDIYGELTLERVAWLLGMDETEARLRLGTLVFDEPGTDRLVAAAEYLSGNVRAKLDAARAAAAEDARYAPNVEALTAVKPVDLTPQEIRVRLGASWVSGAVVQQFLQELLDDPTLKVEHGDGGTDWDVTSRRRASTLATSTWGTERMSAVDIAENLLKQRPVRVYDVDPVTEKRILNPDASLAAQTKATEINERFAEWLWEQPQRANAHLAIYNERFNSLVLRSYDDVRLTLPGLALTFKPHPHQHAAVARMVNEPSVGLFHEVGAGKTAEMVMGVMELRRLGLARKPLIIVPNHMLEQFSREFLQLYPQANLLSASSADLAADRRRLFQARVTTGNWDAVIMTHRAFEQVAMSPQYQKTYLRTKIKKLEARLAAAEANGNKRLIKQLEGSIARAEERIKKKLDTKKDPGLTFEMMGVDYLCVDEGHLFKNLERNSKIPGMGIVGSNRATDLDMKGRWLRETNNRVVTIATATPIANSIGEVHTMLMYLAPQLMTQLLIDEFDGWAATFGETVEGIEVVPEGGGLRMNSRFAKFYNVPELLRILHQVADIKTAEDLQLPVPLLKQREDGQRAPRIVVVPPTDGLEEYLAALVDRADLVRKGLVEPTEDNLLKITHNGRSAAMDLRLVPPTTEEIAAVLHRYEVLDDDDAITQLARAVSGMWTRRRPNPLEPETVSWPSELREEQGRMLWPGQFDSAVERALLTLADRHDWTTGPLATGQILDVLTNHDGLADAAVRELVAAHLMDQWAAEPPDPRTWGSFRWPHQVAGADGQTVWTGELPSSLQQRLITAFRGATDERPLTAAQLADLMDSYDWLSDPAIREQLAAQLADLWSEQPQTGRRYDDYDIRAAETAWPEAIYAPPAVLWSGPFSEEVQAALLAIRGVDATARSKLTIAADTIARIYAEHRDDVFTDADGQPHPRRGALQIVFSDLGVPADGWNAYDELRNLLVARGVPRAQIRFMHEAGNDADKAQLFAAARDGRISVLIGSTEKMGVGTNVQARAVALHHLDCPWRPADLQQREGRILRQGNQSAEVDIFRYVTEGSFDGFMWQTVARKSQFIAQLMRGRLDVREIEDIGDAALSYNEVKALATGNPLLLDQAALQAEVTKLERMERSHHKERDRMGWVRRQSEQDLTILRAEIDEAIAAQARRVDTTGDKFTITVLGQHSTERKQGNIMLRDALTALSKPPPRGVQDIATIGGFVVTAEHRWIEAQDRRLLYVNMPDLPRAEFAISPAELENADLVGRLEKRLRGLEAIVGQLQRDLDGRQQELDRIISGLDAPFKHTDALQAARTRLEAVNAQITDASKSEPPPTPASATPGEAPPPKRRIDPAIIRAGRPGHPGGNDTMQVLTLTIAAIEIYGWASRRDADASDGNLVPTAAIVDTALNGDGYDATALRQELEALVTDDTRAHAAAVREYAIRLTKHDISDYAFQLRLAATEDTVSQRHFATLVSAVSTYQRHMQDKAVREATADSTWQGKAGDKVSFDAKVLASRSYTRAGRGGHTTATTVYLADTSGNLYTWQAGNLNAFRDGTFVRVNGRIKGHDTADGHRQTELTRCMLTPIEMPADWPQAPATVAGPPPEEAPSPEEAAQPVPEPAPAASAPPATPVLPPAVAVTTSVNLEAWAAGPGSRASAADIAWLSDALTALANEPRVQMWARANPVDGFAHPFAARLSDALLDAFEGRPDLLRWAYFGEKPDQAALESAATEAVYAAIQSSVIRQATNTEPSAAAEPDATSLDDAQAVESTAAPGAGGDSHAEPTDDLADGTAPSDARLGDDVAQREAHIRRREIILKIEEHAAGYHNSTGAAHRYIAEMANASPAEWEWIKTYIAEHPEVLQLPYRTPTQWDEIRRTRGEEALQQADAAHTTGDVAAALDHLDEARACGFISATEWHNAREHLHTQDNPARQPETSTPEHGAEPEHDPTELNPPEPDPLAARRAQVRQRQLLLALEQYGPGYQSITGDGVRYAAEAANATREEWDWMAEQVRANPRLMDGKRLGDGQIHDINRQAARRAFAAATEAIKNEDFQGALDRLDDAEVHCPDGHPDRGGTWDKYRAVIFKRGGGAPAALTPENRDDHPGMGPGVSPGMNSTPPAGATAPKGVAALGRLSHPTPSVDGPPTSDQPSSGTTGVSTAATRNGRGR